MVILLHRRLERIISCLGTLLPQDLVHVARRAIDNRRLRDAIRSAAALRRGALAGVVVAEEGTALLHGLLTQLQVDLVAGAQVRLAPMTNGA